MGFGTPDADPGRGLSGYAGCDPLGEAGFNHILPQTVAPADTPNDTNWMALQLGATYALSDKIDLKVSGLT